MITINIKTTKTTYEYITINTNGITTSYTYKKINLKTDGIIRQKNTFNKDVLINYLQSVQIPKKYIIEIEKY